MAMILFGMPPISIRSAEPFKSYKRFTYTHTHTATTSRGELGRGGEVRGSEKFLTSSSFYAKMFLFSFNY
ncbi:Protein of unknown function [Cotesia congregata]|uniref:Uncharacterized protein n=1 Tax=Cotesia congregata TaxID=51543 RepID=A0A8J2H9T2_COTCN|nr:Protein of unknown function [Cotesia congregata]